MRTYADLKEAELEAFFSDVIPREYDWYLRRSPGALPTASSRRMRRGMNEALPSAQPEQDTSDSNGYKHSPGGLLRLPDAFDSQTSVSGL